MTDLGTDFSCGVDLDPALRQSGGRRAIAEAIVRRLSTPLGSFEDYPEYGYDLTELIGSVVVPSRVEQGISAQCRAEESVLEVEVLVVQDDLSLDVSVQAQTISGDLSLTVSVNELGVSAVIPAGD